MTNFCKAPFNNMYFTISGKVSPCWKTVGWCDTWGKDKSIYDIWTGKKFTKYRNSLLFENYNHKCGECKAEADKGVWPLAKAYEEFPVNSYPSLMELELSNQCNLECIMCSGDLSSGIRKNREKKPPLPDIYDETFVEQLKAFIPHLTELRFNGGEPFAQKIVLDICDVVASIKPNLKITIATNGTVYNSRVKHILASCNIHLNISIDSLNTLKYEEIRVNGNYQQLMHNFEKFKKYCHYNSRSLCVMVNPMVNNWEEMVNFVRWADHHCVHLWYNTVKYPEELAIMHLPKDKINHIYTTLRADLNSLPKDILNWDKCDHLINNQISSWR